MDRLLITPIKYEDDIFKQIDKVASRLYELLPHTPITAIGTNFVYELEEDETFDFDIDFNSNIFKKNYDTIGLSLSKISSLRHSLSIKEDSHVILNLSFQNMDDKKHLRMNYHYQADNNSDKIKHSLNKYYANYQHSQLILSKFLRKNKK